mmetsp:Transcript_45243/g.175676  ORF Transcript_45243/g.175676 Transcript_45243/m.175676 type:complete len:387 (-) Transcript_45243:2933-4093(-)
MGGSESHNRLEDGEVECEQSLDKSRSARPRIAIVGAGVSGLAAAEALEETGFFDITLIEARSRIGGRIQTERMGSGFYDLGGQDFLEEDGKDISLLQYCMDKGLSRVKKPMATQLYNRYGPVRRDFKRSGQRWYQELHAEILRKQMAIQNFEEPDKPLDAVIKEFLETALLPSRERRMLAWFTTMMETQTLGEAKKVSSKYWDWAMIQSGISEKSGLENGFGDLVTSLAMRKKILMDVNVKEVTYTGDAGVKIVADDNLELYVDRCIVTVPISVLSAGDLKFSPPLPDRKISAMKAIGTCTLNKVFLEFSERFWSEKDRHFAFIDEELIKGVASSSLRFYLFESLWESTRSSSLLAYSFGADAESQELLSDQEVNDRVDLLQVFRE